MNIIVLQHIPLEDPGYLKDLMLRDGWALTVIQLDQGERIPDDLRPFDAMICMGGPMDTWMEDEYPWLIEEKQAIRDYVTKLEQPFLGFCLGAQLLGEAVGGQVAPSQPPEIGVLDVHLRETGVADRLFADFPATIKAVQWHSYEVQGLDDHPQVEIIASSPTTPYQIFRYKRHAYGVQFHIEVRDTTVQDWGAVSEYKQALEDALGPGALENFERQAQVNMSDMNSHCEKLYRQFKRWLQAR